MQVLLETGMRLVDVVITHPVTNKIKLGKAGHGAIVTGVAVAEAEKKKRDMYNKQYVLPPGSLVPFGLETFGTFGQGAVSLARMVATGDGSATATSPDLTPAQALIMQWFVQRVSVSLQRSNFQAVLTMLDPSDKRLLSREKRAALRSKKDKDEPAKVNRAALQAVGPKKAPVVTATAAPVAKKAATATTKQTAATLQTMVAADKEAVNVMKPVAAKMVAVVTKPTPAPATAQQPAATATLGKPKRRKHAVGDPVSPKPSKSASPLPTVMTSRPRRTVALTFTGAALHRVAPPPAATASSDVQQLISDAIASAPARPPPNTRSVGLKRRILPTTSDGPVAKSAFRSVPSQGAAVTTILPSGTAVSCPSKAGGDTVETSGAAAPAAQASSLHTQGTLAHPLSTLAGVEFGGVDDLHSTRTA